MMSSYTVPGTLIKNRYKVLSVLGGGVAGTVVAVEDARAPNVDKVIKIARKFNVGKHELEGLKKLSSSPFSARFFESFEVPPCYVAIVVEYVGESLSSLLKRKKTRRFSDENAIKVTLDMLNALQHVHEAGFIHRDLHLGNWCMRFHPRPSLYLVDFRHLIRTSCVMGLRSHANSVHCFEDTPMGSLNLMEGNEYNAFDDIQSVFYSALSIVGQTSLFYDKKKEAMRKKKTRIEKQPKKALKSVRFLSKAMVVLGEQREEDEGVDYDALRTALTDTKWKVSQQTPYRTETMSDDTKNLK